ncbi:MAG TPA: hypothetical protein VEV82_05050 [Actinomycetota bacterium]|nr:hypothetical protein [Actinomycetota bacterium]
MPTYEPTEQFWRDYRKLTTAEQEAFRDAVEKFVEDLSNGRDFRKSLRVKPMRGTKGIFEMTWEGQDGRATFQYGAPLSGDENHIIWRRIGSHDIFTNP